MSDRKYSLKYFDVKDVPADVTIGICAKRRGGKSTLIKQLIHDLNPRRIVALIGSEAANTFYNEFIPELFIHTTWDTPFLKRLLAYQRKNYNGDPNKIITLVIDDWTFDKAVMKSAIMIELMKNGRHLGFKIIIAFQYLKDLTRECRSQLDLLFVLRENNRPNQKNLYEEFFSVFPNFGTFTTVMNKATADYGVLVANNTATGTTIQETISYYKADLNLSDFYAGHNKSIEVAKKRLNSDFREGISKLSRKTKKNKVFIA